MTVTLLTLTCVLLLQAPGGDAQPPRERHPLAPSLPLLTDKEYAAIDRVIDRFIAYDVGKLKGQEAAKAVADFKALGPEAIPSLIEGLNRAANLEDSCPAVLIAKKLATLLSGSKDLALLDFARENIGAGVTGKRHTVVLKDLKVSCLLRKSAVQRAGLQEKEPPGPKAPKAMSLGELVAAAGSERGARLKEVLTELEKRPGEKVLPALVAAVANYDEDVQKHGRSLLVRYLGRQTTATLKTNMKVPEQLIPLLNNGDQEVRQAARQALVRLSRGQDFGPERNADAVEVSDAMRQWRAWWEKQGK